MTKKDYELFANEIHSLLHMMSPSEQGVIVGVCIRIFKQDNPSFKQEKFKEACYEGKHIRKSIKGKV